MDIQTIIRKDLWKAIEAHYEKQDYTESLRDAMLFVNEIIQEKSGLYDKDNTALMQNDKLDMFETKYEIIEILQLKLNKSEKEQDYVFYYFENSVFDSSLPLNQTLSNTIHRGLKGENSFNFKKALSDIMESEDENPWQIEFKEDYALAKHDGFEEIDDLDVPF